VFSVSINLSAAQVMHIVHMCFGRKQTATLGRIKSSVCDGTVCGTALCSDIRSAFSCGRSVVDVQHSAEPFVPADATAMLGEARDA
jgi:hypothetical protein